VTKVWTDPLPQAEVERVAPNEDDNLKQRVVLGMEAAAAPRTRAIASAGSMPSSTGTRTARCRCVKSNSFSEIRRLMFRRGQLCWVASCVNTGVLPERAGPTARISL
jgi:hypothetical protein